MADKKKKLSDSEKIAAIIALLKANGISVPPELDDED